MKVFKNAVMIVLFLVMAISLTGCDDDTSDTNWSEENH